MSMTDDDGRPDEALAAALTEWSATGSAGAARRVHAALLSARLLVPLVPLPDDVRRGPELARPTLVGADGRRAVPAFTGLDALARWRRDARPVPLAAIDVITVAVEHDESVVLDVAGPVPFPLEGAPLRALAAGRVPLADDDALTVRSVEGGLSAVAAPACNADDLRDVLAAALGAEPDVAEAYVLAPEEGPDAGDAAIGLVLRADVPPARLVPVVRRLAEALASSPAVPRGVDIAVLTDAQRAAALAIGAPAYVAAR